MSEISEYSELWMPIANYEGLYEVSNFGRIRSLARMVKSGANTMRPLQGKLMDLKVDKDGYLRVGLNKDCKQKYFFVHRLVLLTFFGAAPQGFQTDHIDEDRTNNRLENLRWLSAKDNNLRRNGVILTAEMVLEIRRKALEKTPHKQLAGSYSVGVKTIGDVVQNRSWDWVSEPTTKLNNSGVS